MAAVEMDELLSQFGRGQKDLIPILHRVQAEFGHISSDAISRIADHLNISSNEIYGVLTFYKAFRLRPPGKHLVMVCAGAACHVRGGAEIREAIQRELEIKPGETTADGMFSMETVHCFGCCAIGPTVVVDGKYYVHVAMRDIESIIAEYRDST